MRFLLKCIFWLGGVFLLMPGLTGKSTDTQPPQAPQAQTQQNHLSSGKQQQAPSTASPDLVEQWLQAGKTLQEISTFCERNPALCVAGKAAIQQSGEQALIRAKEVLSGSASQNKEPSASPATEQTPAFKIPVPAQRPG